MNPYNGNGPIFNENPGSLPVSAYLAGFLKIAVNAFIGLDAQGKITLWNPAAEQMYGWTASEMLGKSILELFWPIKTPENQEVQGKWLKDLNEGETIQGKYSLRHKNDSLVIGDYNARAIFDEQGHGLGYVIILRDITERIKADSEIRRLNAELQTQLDELNTLMEMLPVGIWIGNRDCSVIAGNPAAYRITGLSPGINASLLNADQPVGLRIFVDGVEVPPEDAPMQRVARTGKPMYNFENEILFPDQTRKTVYTSVVPIFDGEGTIQKVIGVFSDFTERKQAEEQLRFAREYAEKTADRIARLQKVTEALSGALTPMEVAEALVKQGAPALGAVSGTIMLLSDDGQWLEIVHSATPEALTRPYMRFPVSMNVPAAEAVRLGQPVWIETQQEYLERYPHIANQIIAWGNQTAISIPMEEKGRTLGILALSFKDVLANTPENLGFVQNLARQGAQALERARLYQAEQGARQAAERAADRITRLQQITAALTGLDTAEQLAEAVIHLSVTATGANAGLLVEFLEDSQELKIIAAQGYPQAAIRSESAPHSEPTPLSDCVRTGQAVWIRSQEEFAVRYPAVAGLWGEFGNQATAAIPLVIGERVLGGLAFSFKERREFDLEDREFLLAVAQECAQGLERARAEEALRESEERFRFMADAAPVMIWISGPDALCTWFNKTWLDFVGRTMEEELGKGWTDHIHPDDFDRCLQVYETSFITRLPFTMEYRMKRHDGEYRWLLDSGIPLYGPGDEFTGYIGSCIDFTERKRAEQVLRESEEQLQSLNETLERKVREQTAEVRQLASDLTKAEQRERHRIAHILHEDLQQRIYAIQMQVEYLFDGLESIDVVLQGDIDKVRKQLNEVVLITRHLSVDLSPPILRDEGLTQAIEWLASQIQQQHGLRIEIQANGSFAIPDEDLQMLLFRSVRELLFNVVKHSGVNRAVVALQQENGDLCIQVRDTGRGFDVAALASSINDDVEDDDLHYRSFGLPTLRHRLSLFGGRMEIQSEPGAGTIVSITVPVSESTKDQGITL